MQQLTETQRQYWQKNLRITAILLAIWFFVTFVIGYFARDLNFTLLRLAVQLLGRGPGRADRLCASSSGTTRGT